VILCTFLIVISVGALAVAAETFTIVQGKVLEKGNEDGSRSGRSLSVHTISVLIENNDRVFRIERGTIVKYAVSENDAQRIEVGSEVKLLVSSHQSTAKAIELVPSGF